MNDSPGILVVLSDAAAIDKAVSLDASPVQKGTFMHNLMIVIKKQNEMVKLAKHH